MEKDFISAHKDEMSFEYGAFNIIVSGTGTGKSHFVRNELLNMDIFRDEDGNPDISPKEVIYITSRAMTRDQQAAMEHLRKLGDDDKRAIVRFWNNEKEGVTAKTPTAFADFEQIDDENNITIMTYNQFISILMYMNPRNRQRFQNVKAIVFDECHTLFADTFIENIGGIIIWTQERILRRDILFIGMTATAGIMFEYANLYGLNIRKALPVELINYRAKRLICADASKVEDIIREKLEIGKVIVLCSTVDQCTELHDKFERSAVLWAKQQAKTREQNSPEQIEKMERLREYIIQNNELPSEVDVLFATSTIREGVNLNESSGIKTVVCFRSDEMDVIQFAGRCRFDIENLVVSQLRVWNSGRKGMDYIYKQECLFRDFMRDNSDRRWYETVKQIFYGDFEDIEIVRGETEDVRGFLQTIDGYIVDGDEKYRFLMNGTELVDLANQYRIDIGKSKTNSGVFNMLHDKYGYTKGWIRKMVNGNRARYYGFEGKEEA